MLNISITDHQGRAFWKANWIDRDAISPWATFVDGMKAYFRIPQVRCKIVATTTIAADD